MDEKSTDSGKRKFCKGENSKQEDRPEETAMESVDPSQLRHEIGRIIDNMSRTKEPFGEEADSVIEVSLKEVKIKEHKVDKRNCSKKKERSRSECSSSAVEELPDTCSDSGGTDIGIPQIPICDTPCQMYPNEQELRRHSAMVLDHLSKKKVYVSGRQKSEFFKCPHKIIDSVMVPKDQFKNTKSQPELICRNPHDDGRVTMEKHVDRYHYNHFILRKPKSGHLKKMKEKIPSKKLQNKSAENSKKSISKIFKKRQIQDKNFNIEESQIVPFTKIEDNKSKGKTTCYCGSGALLEKRNKNDNLSSGESISQLYKAKIDPSTNPKSFILRAIDGEILKSCGEVHFIKEDRQRFTEIETVQTLKSADTQQQIPSADENSSKHSIPLSFASQNVNLIQSPRSPASVEPEFEQSLQKSLVCQNQGSWQCENHPIKSRPERIDIYMFDHQDSRYFHTTDNPPLILTETAVHKVEKVATQFWAEIFSILHVTFAFFTTFFLQLIKFILLAIVRPMTTGVIQICSDYFLKPLLTIVFNGLIQPPIIFFYNIFTSFRDLSRPIATGVGYFIRELANLLSALRLCKFTSNTNNGPFLAHPIPEKV